MPKYSDVSRTAFERAIQYLPKDLPKELIDSLRELLDAEQIDDVPRIKLLIERAETEEANAD